MQCFSGCGQQLIPLETKGLGHTLHTRSEWYISHWQRNYIRTLLHCQYVYMACDCYNDIVVKYMNL